MTPIRFVFRIMLSLCFMPALLHAQTTGTITGTVKDVSGAVVPGTQVVIRETSTGTQRTATTNSAGEYAFPSLAPGDYDLKFTSAGFALTDLHATLNVTERIAVDATMQVSGSQTSVDVSAEAPALQTADQTLGRTINGQAIKQLPLATRNFTQILALSPGTSAPLNDATALGRGTTNISADGGRTGSNAFYIDGVDAVNHPRQQRLEQRVRFQQRRHPLARSHPGVQGPDRPLRRDQRPQRWSQRRSRHPQRFRQVPRLGVRVHSQRRSERQPLLLQDGWQSAPGAETESVRRHH